MARHRARLLALLGVLSIIFSLSGCHRSHYRMQADAQAAALISEKANHPHWDLERNWVYADPRSRMFDPFDPDQPPMPPDDPYSHELMHRVDGRPGYPHWDKNGFTPFVENPEWWDYLPLDSNGVLRMSGEDAYQLALLHSTDYQEEFEDLYLSALDVSAEQFRFDPQFFAGYDTFYTTSGRLRNPRSELAAGLFTQETGRLGLPAGGVRVPNSADLLLRKSFITGADLAAGFANSLVWNFAGPNDYTSFTLLDFGLIQPLLRRAGRDRILEQLTIAERALLANVRSMERFRRGFFVEIMTGADAGPGAIRRGGIFGGAGLEGFTGVGSGGFGQVGGGGGGTGTDGGFGGGGAGAGDVGGYLGLLQLLQDIRNQQVTIVGLRSNLAQLRESLRESLAMIPDNVETIIRERLQIAQARQALLNAESRLLNSQAAYQTRLDFFKIELGLPPKLCIEINDPMVEPFNLIDPGVLEIQNRIAILRDSVAVINERLLGAALSSDDVRLDEVNLQLQRLQQYIVRIEQLLAEVQSQTLPETRADIEALRASVPARREQLVKLQSKFEFEYGRFAEYGNLDPCQMTLLADIDPAVFDVQRLDDAPDLLQGESDQLEAKFASFIEPLSDVKQYVQELLDESTRPATIKSEELEQRVIYAVPSILSDLSDDVLDLSLIQARASTDTVDLVSIDLDWTAAVEIARQFRRDWMNRRASLVDSWRLIEFNADNLESTLDIVVNGDVQNVGDNPFNLNSINGQLQMGLRFDAPITRLQERNTYRQSLIEFAESRRTYYQYVDNVIASLRGTIRSIELNQVNFEERRIAVLSAIDQVVLNDQIQKLREERGLATGVTAARDVVSALADLQTAQNDFLSVWLNYEAQRLSLDWNLGTMNLGPDGVWIDPGPIGEEFGFPQPIDWPCMPEILVDPAADPELLPYMDGEELDIVPIPDPLPAAAAAAAGRPTGIIHSQFLDSLTPDESAVQRASDTPLHRLPAVFAR